MTLNDYMTAHEVTDKSFAEQIGRSRKQVIFYRQGKAVPRKGAMERIYEVTGGMVTPSSFFRMQPNE